MSQQSTDIKVSVLIFSFNQEDFIANALDSVLNQEVDFNYEIIVSDDGSSDKTMEIIQDYNQKFPGKLIILDSKKNGILTNVTRVFPSIKGEYIALLDGDDYWIYEHKLQKQVDFLEENLDYTAVFHDAQILQEESAEKILFNGKKYYSQLYNYPTEIYTREIINRLILPTASCVLRTNVFSKIDLSKIKDFYSLDWKIYSFAVLDSKFYYFNEPWSVYRNHNKGISKSNNDQFHLSHIAFLKGLLTDEFYRDYKYDIYTALANEFRILLNSKISELNKRKLFRNYLSAEIQKIRFYRKQLFNKKCAE